MAEELDFQRTSRPLEGVVLCCTSIPVDIRNNIHRHAEEMGATMKQDLTSDVTHLCVGSTNTPKYKYVATQRPDVHVVTADFIDSIRALWLEGIDVIVSELEEQFRLPTFWGLKVCVTNLPEDQRNEVSEIVQRNGGQYYGDLTKDITHLVVGEPTGKKYQFAQSWKIQCVSIEWPYESEERQMALDERFFHPEVIKEKRGKGAWIRPNPKKRKSSGLEGMVGVENEQVRPSALEATRRKIRRTASQRLSSNSLGLWGDIMGQANAPKMIEKDQWEETVAPVRRPAPVTGDVTHEPHTLKNDASNGNKARLPFENDDEDAAGMFVGIVFYIHGFDQKKSAVLRGLLGSFGSDVFLTFEQFKRSSHSRHIVIVPETTRQAEILSLKEISSNVEFVTNWWVEKCMHGNRFVEPSDYLLGQPFKKTFLEEFKHLTVTISRFDGVDFLHAHKAISLLGATWFDQLGQKRDLLVVKSPYNGEKADKIEAAIEWGIPIVKAEWLYDCITDAELIPYKNYLIAGSVDKKRATSPEGDIRELLKVNESIRLAKMKSPAKKRTSDRVLMGRVLYISPTLKDHRSKIETLIRALGGALVSSLENAESVTHLIRHPKAMDYISELERARKILGCHVVSPRWLQECHKLTFQPNEKDYPGCEATLLQMEESNPQNSHSNPQESIALEAEVESLAIDKHQPESNREPGPDRGPFFFDDSDAEAADVSPPDRPESILRKNSTNDPPRTIQVNDSFSAITDSENFQSIPEEQPDMLPPPPPPPPAPIPLPLADPIKTNEAIKDIINFRREASALQGQRKKSKGPLLGRAKSGLSSLTRSNSTLSSASPSEDSNPPAAAPAAVPAPGNPEIQVYPSTYDEDDTVDLDAVASQMVHYADPGAEVEKAKMLERLSLAADSLKMPGRNISMSTAAVEDIIGDGTGSGDVGLGGRKRMTRAREAKRGL